LLIAILLVALPSCRQSPQFPENEEKPNEFSQYSALQIDDSVKSALGVGENEQVIRFYNISTERACSQYGTIEEVLASDYVLQAHYAVINDDGIKVYRVDENSNVDEIRYGIRFTENETMSVLLNNTVLEQFPQGAKVLDVYYLWGENNYAGSALYYRTDKGDFVYYNYFLTYAVLGKQQTFFTKDEFFDLMRAIDDYQSDRDPNSDGK
jgi:hypothetical protein